MADEEAGHALASPSLCGWEGAWKGQPLSARRGPDGTCVTWTQLRLLLSLPQPRRGLTQPCHLTSVTLMARKQPCWVPLRGASEVLQETLQPSPESSPFLSPAVLTNDKNQSTGQKSPTCEGVQ